MKYFLMLLAFTSLHAAAGMKITETNAEFPAESLQIDLQGKILNEQGVPVLATVTVKNTTNATSTNDNGEFTLRNVDANAVLVISGVGMENVEVPVNGRTNLTITVKTRVTVGEAVVISTGYAQVQKEKLTGAASYLGQKIYDQRVAVSGNFTESLEGKVPGVVLNNQTGEISIRGVSTFDAVKKPLIVVDGFPTEIDIRSINPNDIVSINVLKDAAAASIYGARASNGVIVIETKRGKSGKPVFSLRATTAFEERPGFGYLKFGSALEYAKIQQASSLLGDGSRSSFINAHAPISPVQDAVFDFKEGLIDSATLNSRIAAIGATDNLAQYEDLFYRNRWSNQVDFNVSGGNEKNTFLIGMNYLTDRLTTQRNDNERLLINVASTHQFNKRMNFDFRANYTMLKNQNAGNTGGIRKFSNKVGIDKFYPYESLVDESGQALPVSVGPDRNAYTGIRADANEANMKLGLYDQLYYPYRELYANTNTVRSTAMRFQGRLNTKLTGWLSLDLGGAYEEAPAIEERLQTEEAFYVRRLVNYKASADPVTGVANFNDLPKGDLLTRVNAKTGNYTVRGQFNVNYHSPNLDHSLTGIAGTEVRKSVQSSFMSTYFGYNEQTLLARPVNFVKIQTSVKPPYENMPTRSNPSLIYNNFFGETYDDRRFVSYYADANYVYLGRYGLSGSIRMDQTNLFGTDPKYRNKPFYSVGANWRISRESFMEALPWMSDLKLRAAYGVNGNIPTSQNGPFLILESGINYYVSPYFTYFDVQSPKNQSLRWEKTDNLNIGLDFGVLSNRVTGSIDYYRKNATDVFGQYSSDPTSGFNEFNANTASILNHGVEIGIQSLNIESGLFTWQTYLTASINTNKVTEVKTISNSETGEPLISILDVQKGYPLNSVFAYDYVGLNKEGLPQIMGADGKIKKVTGSSTGTQEVELQDMHYMGTTLPKYVVGLNNRFTYGKFDLSFLFMYYGGYVTRVEAPDPARIGNKGRLLEGSGNFWKKPGDEAQTDIPGIPVINTPGYFDAFARTGYTYASKFVKKADNIRLRDVILTYHLTPQFLTDMGLTNTELRAQVQNAWNYTFSGNDIDPDAINRSTGERMLKQKPYFSLSLYTNF